MKKVWVEYLEEPKLAQPVAIAAAQGLRSVGRIAVKYLIEKLKPRLFAKLYCVDFCVEYFGPSYLGYSGIAGCEVSNGIAELPCIRFYWHAKPELVLTDGHQAAYPSQYEVVRRTVDIYERLGVRRIISLGAHATDGSIQCLAGDKEIIEEMERHDIERTKTDRFIGFSGLVLGEGKKRGMKSLGLLGKTAPSMELEEPDRDAAKALLDKLREILEIDVDTSELAVEERREEELYFA
ncbi:MAG: PAC2 family protein [Candidatus Hydrothermarchaeota archaeon]|nr:PAC2 family protein [Candidatus Hydrothermarchaeota archaeon]